MKSTDIERSNRELKRAQKKEEYIQGKLNRETPSVGDYINKLHDMMFFDETRVYGIEDNEDILMCFIEMKTDIPEKQWDNVIKKAVRKTKVAEKDEAVEALNKLLELAD